MNDIEESVFEVVRLWIWSGYCSREKLQNLLYEVIALEKEGLDEDEELDENLLRQAFDAECAAKAQAELSWPAVTDCDRLDSAFTKLLNDGILAWHNAGDCMSAGHEIISEHLARSEAGTYRGFCFFHEQDLERALAGEGLMIAFGDLEDDTDATIKVGGSIKQALEEAGLKTQWDSTADGRINIPNITWQRRS
ncbi:MAG: hypothetical protein V4623_03390 [Pseudomonadota bacterium]